MFERRCFKDAALVPRVEINMPQDEDPLDEGSVAFNAYMHVSRFRFRLHIIRKEFWLSLIDK